MSPLSLSATLAQAPREINPKAVRFGTSPEKAQSIQVTEAPQDSVEMGKDTNSNPVEQGQTNPNAPKLSFRERLTRFFDYLKKAFNVLFRGDKKDASEPPESELDLKLKTLKQNFKMALADEALPNSPAAKLALQEQLTGLNDTVEKALDDDDLLQHLKNKSESVVSSPEKEQYREVLNDVKTPEGRQQFVKDYLEKPSAKVLELVNRTERLNLSEAQFKRILSTTPEQAPYLYKAAGVIPDSKRVPLNERARRALTPDAIRRTFAADARNH
jgi:hypothetical protein